jgi:hypothetical protein
MVPNCWCSGSSTAKSNGIYNVAEPDPGFGIGIFRIPDLGTQTHIFESLMTFWGRKFFVNWPNFFLH